MEIRVEMRKVATRRRGTVLESAILDAAVAELSEHGYAGFTMDAVASRAGTNKNAIYRRWPSRTALAAAAYKSLIERPDEVPDTGDLRGDVLAILQSVIARIGSPEAMRILGPLLADARSDPALMADLREQLAIHPDRMVAVLQRAIDRGEARPDCLHPRIYRVPIMLIQAEYLTAGPQGVDDHVLTEIVDLVFLPLVSAGTG